MFRREAAGSGRALPPDGPWSYLDRVRETVRKQSVMLGLGMAAAFASFTAGSIAHALFHVSESVIAFPLLAIFWFLLLKHGPDGWR